MDKFFKNSIELSNCLCVHLSFQHSNPFAATQKTQPSYPLLTPKQPETKTCISFSNNFNFQNAVTNICQATNKQLFQLVDWAKHIPHFTSLPLQDQVLLLRAGWNELLIAAFSHRSIEARDGIVLATGLTIHRFVLCV